MRKKIIFLGPKNDGGVGKYLKGIHSFLEKNNGQLIETYYYNNFFDYFRLHFVKADVIFSSIPFIFRPLFTKKYYFNLHGNYKVERKNKSLGVKLLYFTKFNFYFCNKIVLTSFFLADKLELKEKYKEKIFILPNYIEKINKKNNKEEKNNYNFLTITSFNFFDKGLGVLNIGNVIKKIGLFYKGKKISFSIVGDGNKINEIKKEFEKIIFSNNVKVKWEGFLNKKELEKKYLSNNTFLYWTNLDNTPTVVYEALNYNLNVFINNYESFGYVFPKEIISETEQEMFNKIILNKVKENSKIKLNYDSDIVELLLKELDLF